MNLYVFEFFSNGFSLGDIDVKATSREEAEGILQRDLTLGVDLSLDEWDSYEFKETIFDIEF